MPGKQVSVFQLAPNGNQTPVAHSYLALSAFEPRQIFLQRAVVFKLSDPPHSDAGQGGVVQHLGHDGQLSCLGRAEGLGRLQLWMKDKE